MSFPSYLNAAFCLKTYLLLLESPWLQKLWSSLLILFKRHKGQYQWSTGDSAKPGSFTDITKKGAKSDSVSLGFNPSITTSFLRHLDDNNSWIFYFLIFFYFEAQLISCYLGLTGRKHNHPAICLAPMIQWQANDSL